jgi:hypothetical protein
MMFPASASQRIAFKLWVPQSMPRNIIMGMLQTFQVIGHQSSVIGRQSLIHGSSESPGAAFQTTLIPLPMTDDR